MDGQRARVLLRAERFRLQERLKALAGEEATIATRIRQQLASFDRAQHRLEAGAELTAEECRLDTPVIFWECEGVSTRSEGHMTESIALGVNGLSIPPGTHICAFFRGIPERDEIMVPFLMEGLRAGDKCTCIIDDGVDGVRTALGAALAPCAAGGQLHIQPSKDAYLRRGTFSTQGMLDFWEESVGAALGEQGFPFSRSVGDATFTLRELPDLYDFMTYEAELNRFLPRYPQVIMCLYDLDRFGGQVLVEILKTHPKVLMGSTVLDNLYYLEPDEFLASRGR
jgi:hypothetical protein